MRVEFDRTFHAGHVRDRHPLARESGRRGFMLTIHPILSGYVAQYADGPLVVGSCPLKCCDEALYLALLKIRMEALDRDTATA